MAVLIGHASIDENGRATGGAAGDSTGKEVCTRDWYARDWNVLLRPARDDLAEKSAAACEAACANENIGYDQTGRNTLYTESKKVEFDLSGIETPCECDCSSLMHVCAIAGGADIPYHSNGCTTRTMVRSFTDSGDYIKLTGKEFLTSPQKLRRGDILVKEGSHTVMVLGDTLIAGATASDPDHGARCSVRLPVLRAGQKHDAVRGLQILLRGYGLDAPASGVFEERTEKSLKHFQLRFNLDPDGKCGPDTWSALLGLTGVG